MHEITMRPIITTVVTNVLHMPDVVPHIPKINKEKTTDLPVLLPRYMHNEIFAGPQNSVHECNIVETSAGPIAIGILNLFIDPDSQTRCPAI